MRGNFIAVCLLFVLSIGLSVNVAHATFTNPKSVESLTARLTQGGTITINSYISKLNLTVYIPQEGVQSIDVQPSNWRYTQDAFGNKQIIFEWNEPVGVIEYKVESVITNTAKHLSSEKSIGYNQLFLKETPQIIFNDDIRKIAYPYEKSLKRAVELSEWVNGYMTYDSSYAGKRLPSDAVLMQKRGVCVEYANLLASLLRVSGIPTKYITGYAYSTVDKKFIGHTWVEVIADDGSGIGIDPTWDEAGYIDATHIKTGEMLDDNQSEVLMFTGSGNVDWKRNDEEFQILDYKEGSPVQISSTGGGFSSNGYGFIKADVKDECSILEISANTCVDDRSREVLNIYDPSRKIWSCGEKDIYWFFKPQSYGENRFVSYTCPVNIFDQTGARTVPDITINGNAPVKNIFITGPDSVGVNENFQLESSEDSGFIFYSPTLEQKNDYNAWKLSLDKPGDYYFYLYSDGALATKKVSVLERTEYSLAVSAPKNATLGSSFLVSVSVKNLLAEAKNGRIKLDFDGTSFEKSFTVAPAGEYDTNFNVSAQNIGSKELSVSAMGDSITTYSTQVYVYEQKERGIFDAIAEFFSGIFKAISEFFSGLFK